MAVRFCDLDNQSNHSAQSNHQVSGSSSHSFSVISEPPDIRNWFSGYEYQSPQLGSENMGNPSANEEAIERDESGMRVEDTEATQEKRNDYCFTAHKGHLDENALDETAGRGAAGVSQSMADEIPEYPVSLSLISEPPDIRNWFSGYVYESPVLDSDDIEVSPSGRVTCRNKTKEVLQEEQDDRKLSFTKSIGIPAITKEIAPYSSVKYNNCVVQVMNEVVCPGKDHKVPEENRERQPLSNHEIPVKKKRSCMKLQDLESTEENVDSNMRHGITIGWISPNCAFRKSCNEISWRESNVRIAAKRNSASTEKDTRSSLCCKDKSLGQKQLKSQNETNAHLVPANDTNDTSMRRKALNELTNFHQHNGVEVAGKWKCPQKSKPKVGPPLKQLRLEQWVRRV
ncbi:hypothetical protein Droror1_Dr00005273 [Drosera rotundifolia]